MGEKVIRDQDDLFDIRFATVSAATKSTVEGVFSLLVCQLNRAIRLITPVM